MRGRLSRRFPRRLRPSPRSPPRRADAGDRASTAERRLAAIAKAHRVARLESPTRAAVFRETPRASAASSARPLAGRDPVVTGRLLALLSITGTDLRGIRDRAVLSLGFVGGLRRSEMVALGLEDVRFSDAGALVTIRRSKTDQEAESRTVELAATGAATCPVAALQSWIAAASLTKGPLFRELDRRGAKLETGRMSDRAVARTVQRLARVAGLEGDFGGHSLRAGFATSAVAAGVAREMVLRQGGWRSEKIMRGYVRAAETFRVNYSAALGL